MKHKSGTLTNLELGLFNALAVETMLDVYWRGGTLEEGRGGKFMASRIVGRAGYDKTTSYHYKLLNRLVEYGYLSKTSSAGNSFYSLGVSGFRWLNLNEAAQAALELERQSVANQISKAHARIAEMRAIVGDVRPTDSVGVSDVELDDIPF